VLTYVDVKLEAGKWSTGVFQILSAGNTGQPPTVGGCAQDAEAPSAAIARAMKKGVNRPFIPMSYEY
jgi:hypothetical protein